MKLLQITDGITTIDFLDMASGYSLEEEGYAPAVANVENSQLAGRSRYTTVQDSMRILVHDTTTTTANENLIALRLLMEKAERWGRGERVEPVRIRLQIADDELPQENVIYAPSGNGVIMTLPPQHMSIDIVRISYPVTLRFTRRGEWLAYSRNLLPNSSFEIFAGGQFAGWTMVGTVTQSDVDSQFGTYSALVSSGDGLYVDITNTAEGEAYTATVWVRQTGEAGAAVLTASDAVTGSNAVTASSSGTDWQRLQVTKIAPAAGIRFQLSSTLPVYFDGAQLELGTTATPWSDEDLFIATSTAATVPSIHTLTWDSDQPSAGHMNPTDLVLSYFRDSTPDNGRKQETLIAIADSVDDIQLRNADDTTDSATKVSDVSRSPSSASGQVVSGSGELAFSVGSFYAKFAIFPSKDVFDIDVFATFRTTSSIPFFVNMAIVSEGQEFQTETVVVQNSGVDPFIVYLGSVQSVTAIKNIVMQTSKESSSIVVNSIRMDSVLVLNNNTRSSGALLLSSPQEAGLAIPTYQNTSMFPFSGNVPNNYLTAGKAIRVSQTLGVDIAESLAFQGNLSLATVGQSFVACALTVRETYWTMSNTTGDKFQAQYTATRAVTNLVPK